MFNKKLALIAFAAATVLTLIALGCWQLHRLSWKNDLIAHYEQTKQMQPVPIATILSKLQSSDCRDISPRAAGADAAIHKTRHNRLSSTCKLNELNYMPVTVSGELLHNLEFHLGGRRYYGQTGYNILTILKLPDGRGILVDRGWVPSELKDATKRPAESMPKRLDNISAIIKLPEAPRLFTPANHPEKNFWFTIDIPAMSAIAKMDLPPIIVQLVADNHADEAFPIPAPANINFRNDHFGYAITWFILAIAASVIFWRLYRQNFSK